MSSRADAKKWKTFCTHLREAIIDEHKAVPDYEKLIKQAEAVFRAPASLDIKETVRSIIEDEKEHKRKLRPLFNQLCYTMPSWRKDIP